jgi:chromosome segregation ATPase
MVGDACPMVSKVKDTPTSPASPSGRIKFPPPPPPAKALTLRRRLEAAEGSAEARKSIQSINAIVAATRAPCGELRPMDSQQVLELQKALRQLEGKLEEREHAMEDILVRLAERERELAETEALLTAREKVIVAARQPGRAPTDSKEGKSALGRLKAEVERQSESLKEQKAALKEREEFVQENEAKLFEKMQAQQEKEVELEQKADDLHSREKRLLDREAAIDPAVAAALKAEKAARKFDEFKE